MAIEVTDVGIEKQSASASSPSEEQVVLPEEDTMEQQPPEKEEAQAAVAATRWGRPPGSKDKQPRKRAPPRAPFPDDIEDLPPAPGPLTRRSTVPRAQQHSAPRRRVVQIVAESDSPKSTSADEEEETPPPSPRTKRHQEWTAYRQQQATAHQANVNHYAGLFDRMLA